MAENTAKASDIAYRKKRVKRIKRIIIGTCVFLLVFPTIMSIYLMIQVHSLKNEISKISAERFETQEKNIATPEPTPESTPEPEKKRVYLTFDDSPGTNTDEILDILKKSDTKATFFTVGKEDAEAKKIYKRIVKEGHTLGMHSYLHLYDELYKSKETFEKDFLKIYDLLQKETGLEPKWYRFPGGSSTQNAKLPIQTYIDVLSDKKVQYIDWNVISPDINEPSATKDDVVDGIVKNVLKFDTSVVLMYDSVDREMTVKALPLLIKKLKQENYELLPIDEDTPLVQHNH